MKYYVLSGCDAFCGTAIVVDAGSDREAKDLARACWPCRRCFPETAWTVAELMVFFDVSDVGVRLQMEALFGIVCLPKTNDIGVLRKDDPCRMNQN